MNTEKQTNQTIKRKMNHQPTIKNSNEQLRMIVLRYYKITQNSDGKKQYLLEKSEEITEQVIRAVSKEVWRKWLQRCA